MEEKNILRSALNVCLALQNGEEAKAKELMPEFNKELEVTVPKEQLAALKLVLSTALRKRNYAFFKEQLCAYEKLVLELVAEPNLVQVAEDFVDFLIYNVCDRRLVGERRVSRHVVESFVRNVPQSQLLGFWNEWSSLLLRIVRRRWLGETEWLLTLMLKELWYKRDLKLMQQVLWQLQLHMAMHGRTEGMESVFRAYKPLFYSFLVVIDCAGRVKTLRTSAPYTQLVLRSMRDIVNQLARGQMQEQQEIFLAIYELWLKDAKDNPLEPDREDLPVWKRPASGSKKLEERIQCFMQLAISYWAQTNPKTSKRQLEYLQKIMEPRKISPELRNILKRLG